MAADIVADAIGGSQEVEGKSEMSNSEPESPDSVIDGVEGEGEGDGTCEQFEDDSGSESESDEEFEDAQEEEAMPDGDTNQDLHALLAFSKSRLEKTATTGDAEQQQQPAAAPPQAASEEDDDSETEIVAEEAVANGESDQTNGTSPTAESPADEKKIEAEEPVKDQAYFLELAMKKGKDAKEKATNDQDQAYLMKLAEKKVAEAEAKAKEDEEALGENVIKPALTAQPTRSENSEIWALLNYSKTRLETGATPQVGKKGSSKAGSKGGSTRGDDMSVSSKLSKASKRSMSSKRSLTAHVTVVGGPGDLPSPLGTLASEHNAENEDDVPFPDVTDGGEASVDGSVSLENSVANEDESDSDEDSNDEEDSSEEDDEEEEDELPSFLKDEQDAIDPEEAKALYEAAKFKAASILSVSEEKLTDVQMLQAIAIAEEAAQKGDEKFSTKRSLFKLNEAKVEDLKNFLSLSMSKTAESGEGTEDMGWGIGGGRLRKKLGSQWKNFRERCDEIDETKQRQRQGQPTTTEMMSAAMLDLKAQIDEYEKTVKSTMKKPS
ncbi:hypothetical protein ACHAXT_001092 [Thalassiosira profunda]